MAGDETDGEHRFRRVSRAPRVLDRGGRLRERKPCVIQERAACLRQFDTARAAPEQLCADFLFEVAHLPAEGGLRGVQPPFGGKLQAAFLGDGNEVTKMPQLHRRPYTSPDT